MSFYAEHPLEGYLCLTYMLMDADLVAASPATVYRVLKQAGCLERRNRKETVKGRGFQQPLAPHEHWHVDISYVNVCGTFYYLVSVLDAAVGSSSIGSCARDERGRRGSGTAATAAVVPRRTPRIITDNGPQFVAKDFKEFIRLCGMTHVKTVLTIRRAMAKSNAGTARSSATACANVPLSIADARQLVAGFVEHYNQVRLHSAIGTLRRPTS